MFPSQLPPQRYSRGMARKLGHVVGGIVLVGIFLAWMLSKGTSTVRAWTDPNPLLGLIVLGLAWLCALGGAALLARGAFRQGSSPADERD